MISGFDITSYSSRYKKDYDASVFLYRPYTRACDFCEHLQQDDHSDLVFEDLVWASSSLLEVICQKEHDVVYLSEAEMKTYPTRFLTRELAKDICAGFKLSCCVFDVSLDHGEIFKQGSSFIYNAKSKRCIEWERSDGSSFPCIVQAFSDNVEDDVAGTVCYRVILENEGSITSELISNLIHSGDRFGYDYVAYSTRRKKDCWFFFVKFEAKFQKNGSIQIEDKLYHLSRSSKKDAILKGGLQPRSSSTINGIKVKHKDRVYLFNGYDEKIIQGYVDQLDKRDKVFNKKTRKFDDTETTYVLFEIDRKKISDLKLYRDNMYQSEDPNHPYALYTYSNIPPSALKFVSEFKKS